MSKKLRKPKINKSKFINSFKLINLIITLKYLSKNFCNNLLNNHYLIKKNKARKIKYKPLIKGRKIYKLKKKMIKVVKIRDNRSGNKNQQIKKRKKIKSKKLSEISKIQLI